MSETTTTIAVPERYEPLLKTILECGVLHNGFALRLVQVLKELRATEELYADALFHEAKSWHRYPDEMPQVKLGDTWSGLATDGRIVFTAKFSITQYNSLTGEHSYAWTSPEFAGDITAYITGWRAMPALPPKKS